VACIGLWLLAAASYRASPHAAGFLVSGTLVLAFGVFVAWRGPQAAVNRAFLSLSVSYAGYIYLVYFLHLATATGIDAVKIPVWLLRNGLFMVPVTSVYFASSFVGSRSRILRYLPWIALASMLPFVVLNAGGLYITEYKLGPGSATYKPANGLLLYMISAVVTLFWLLVSVGLMAAQCFRPSQRARRPQFLIVLGGWGASIFLATLGYGTAFGSTYFPSFTGLTWAGFPLTLGFAVIRFSLFDIKIVIRRTLPYALGTALIGGLYAACLAGLESAGQTLDLLPAGSGWVLLLILMGLGFQPVLEGLQRGLDRLFFRAEAELDRFLSEAGARYGAADSEQVLAGMVARDAVAALRLEGAIVLLGSQTVTCFAARPDDSRVQELQGLAMPADSANQLMALGSVNASGGEEHKLFSALTQAGAQLLAPFGGEATRGLLACREKKSHAAFSSRDRMFLTALASQAGTALSRLEAREDASTLQKLTDAIFESMSDAVAVVDRGGRVVSCNPAFRNRFSSAVGDDLGDIGLASVIREATPRPFELETDQGLFLVSTRPLEGASQAGKRVVVLVDVTELRRLQEADHRRKALAELGATISSINHEIGNIVSPLNHYIASARKLAPPDEVREHLDAAAERLRVLQSLSSEMREYYREPTLSPCRVPLAELVESALADVRATAGRTWSAPRTAGLDFDLIADMQKMKQVLVNVTKNAWEAMADSPRREWSVSAERIDGVATISVTDSGPGIPPEKLERLFEPFYTTKKERGTGLGLAIARRIVEAHGAEIDVESTPGESTTVTITWPLDQGGG
jgi:signal transduction histidine kinase